MQHCLRPPTRLGLAAGIACPSGLPARPTCATSCAAASRSHAAVGTLLAGSQQGQGASSPQAGEAPTATTKPWRPSTDDELHGASSASAHNEQPAWNRDGTALATGSGLMASPMLLAVTATAMALLCPPVGHCAESLNEGSLALFQNFLDYVESLGSAGPLVFIITVMLFEMVPLFPTQPLSIASGLLFGPVTGALSMLAGMTLAANNAFWVSRGVGRKLAEKVIVMEMGEGHGQGPVAKKLAEVQHAIRTGGFWKQLTAIILLRLTPVVPFSASNYMLGLTPVQVPAYLGGTVIGVSAWSVLYAWLGAASRQLLDGGMDLASVVADLGDRAGKYSSTALSISLGFGVLAAIVYAATQASQAAQGTEQPAADESKYSGRSPNDADVGEREQRNMYQPAQHKR